MLATYPELSEELGTYPERLQLYTLEKALRESKRNSSWEEPDAQYEEQTRNFITQLLDERRPFWADFKRFHQKLSAFGGLNSLSSLVLKFGCPGVPDIYQGSGLWDLSMVDPDNRRPVDYKLRAKYLAEIKQEGTSLKSLWKEAGNGKIKLFLLHRLLSLRQRFPVLFAEGQYLPLEVKGKGAAQLLSFARRYKNDWLIFVIPLNPGTLEISDAAEFSTAIWEDTRVIMPEGIPERYIDTLRLGKDKRKISKEIGTAELQVKEVFSDFPLAILHFQQEKHKRAAGVLMPVFSLPSICGIGDFGPEARTFIDFLSAAGQKYWQVLPLNPVNVAQTYSPYSAVSVMAGNTLFISPELLLKDQLLTKENIEQHAVKASNKVKYKQVEKLKNELLAACL